MAVRHCSCSTDRVAMSPVEKSVLILLRFFDLSGEGIDAQFDKVSKIRILSLTRVACVYQSCVPKASRYSSIRRAKWRVGFAAMICCPRAVAVSILLSLTQQPPQRNLLIGDTLHCALQAEVIGDAVSRHS